MRTTGKAPGALVGAAVEWQANRIADPVERLRFLRRTVGDRRVWDPRTSAGRAWWRRRRTRALIVMAGALLLPAGTMTSAGRLWKRSAVVTAKANEAGPEAFPQVWLVEQNKEFETYSNGLRVERRFEVGFEPRSYPVFRRGQEDSGPLEERSTPAGLVFHTTESAQAEFAEGQTRRMRIIGEALLDYVRKEHAYHYLVDRFGRVWRVVRESDAANHAGYSVWADSQFTYVNLNRAFLGIAVETTTQSGAEKTQATPAQMHALRVVTEMLRARYRIPARDCATHAQVSVNPDNMQAGYHYDWADNFPYAELGLPDNYAIPAPSLWLFGFTYDPSLVKVTGEAFWRGLVLGEEQFRQNATANGLGAAAYRQALVRRYRQILSNLKSRTELSKEKEG